jgi:AraC-like DNA-binding protein
MTSTVSVASQPSVRLRPLLTRDYVAFRQAGADGGTWLVPPATTATVIINMADSFGGLPRAFAAGLTDTHGLVDQTGAFTCVDLKLTPLGAYQLLGLPMAELTNRVVDLADLGLGALADRLATACDPFAVLDEVLLGRAADGPEPAGEVAWVWRRLHDSGGNATIGALAAEVGWSRRHLVNRFREQVGLPPKTVARIVRFEELLRGIAAGRPLADGAAACGYYDQAHMNRDFREFAGTTPTEYLARFPSVQYPWVPAA